MPMTYKEVKYHILFKWHKHIDYWHKLVGEMFEETKGFTVAGKLKKRYEGELYEVAWSNYEWRINRV